MNLAGMKAWTVVALALIAGCSAASTPAQPKGGKRVRLYNHAGWPPDEWRHQQHVAISATGWAELDDGTLISGTIVVDDDRE
jgi:hypothetical protein